MDEHEVPVLKVLPGGWAPPSEEEILQVEAPRLRLSRHDAKERMGFVAKLASTISTVAIVWRTERQNAKNGAVANRTGGRRDSQPVSVRRAHFVFDRFRLYRIPGGSPNDRLSIISPVCVMSTWQRSSRPIARLPE